MLNCNTAQSECIKAISVMQRLGCALVMQGEWWIQGLFQVFLILSFLVNGEGLCSVQVFSDQRISGLCATSASTVFFFSLCPCVSELSIKCFLVFHSYPVHLVVLAWHLSSALWPFSACFYHLLPSATSLGDHPSVHLSYLSAFSFAS